MLIIDSSECRVDLSPSHLPIASLSSSARAPLGMTLELLNPLHTYIVQQGTTQNLLLSKGKYSTSPLVLRKS